MHCCAFYEFTTILWLSLVQKFYSLIVCLDSGWCRGAVLLQLWQLLQEQTMMASRLWCSDADVQHWGQRCAPGHRDVSTRKGTSPKSNYSNLCNLTLAIRFVSDGIQKKTNVQNTLAHLNHQLWSSLLFWKSVETQLLDKEKTVEQLSFSLIIVL